MAEKKTLQLPTQMKSKLLQFRKRVWMIKLVEGIGAAAVGLVLSYLIVFTLDRFYDTSAWLRWTLLVVGSLGLAVWFPLVCHKWIWGSRRMEQVARLLKVNHPRLGDYLLGIIELVNHNDFRGNSEALTRAALEQADRETAGKDFSNDVPYPKHRRWALAAGIPLALAAVLFCIFPAAGGNALQRWIMPWRNLDRFTFTRLELVPESMVVPLSEPVALNTRLAETTQWQPECGSVWIGDYEVQSPRQDRDYAFELPPFQTAGDVDVRVGDVLETIHVDPRPRPELQTLTAVVYLPEYLQRTEPVRTEIRGGGVSIVKGSEVQLQADATRPLSVAHMDDQPISVTGNHLSTESVVMDQSRTVTLGWEDQLGLSAKTPLLLKLRCATDQAPTLTCRELEKKRVIMLKDVLSFEIDAADDFGVKTIGMQWVGQPAETSAADPAEGEKIISAGNPEATEISSVVATFSPQREQIEPQVISLRLFAEDYLPGRPRVYSQPYTVYILSEDDHAVWMTNRLNDWFKKGLETYEREQQLYNRNVQLRNLPAQQLDRTETRSQIESQATAERAQSRRLKSLTDAGERLIQEAARNDQFGVDHLETLAKMLERLQDIHENRMPSVADLLTKASQAAAKDDESQNRSAKPSDSGQPKQGASSESSPGSSYDSPETTSVTDQPENPGSSPDGNKAASKDSAEQDQPKPKNGPTTSMKESSMDSPPKSTEQESPPEDSPPNKPSQLRLPNVVLNDPAKKQAGACPAAQQMDQAVASQETLLAEFQEVAEELQKLISNLEGSTFVKRLKAMSRRELVVARDVTETSLQGFGERQTAVQPAAVKRTKLIAKRQRAHAKLLQNIQDDLDAYANRVQQGKFKTVLAEMRDLEAINQINIVADRMEANEPGTSIAQAELLADTFDRWAEQLVGPG